MQSIDQPTPPTIDMAKKSAKKPSKPAAKVGRPRTVQIPDDLTGTIARNVIRLREKLGLSVDECATKAKVNRISWFRLETGGRTRTSISMLPIAAKVLGVGESDLLKPAKK